MGEGHFGVSRAEFDGAARHSLEAGPFALFEDMRPGAGAARLFVNPVKIISTSETAGVPVALEDIRRGVRAGLYAAGWLAYEAGYAFEPRLARRASAAAPLLWFGLFEQAQALDARDVARLLPAAEGAWVSPAKPRITRQVYEERFDRVQRFLRDGDIYQLNLSYRADLSILGHPLAAYRRLRETGGGGWSGVVNNGRDWLLSTSPELFFRLDDGVIEARPMKGTARRDADGARDADAAAGLRADPKEIAENLMIVDLLRNDIARVAEAGSVHVPALFTIETYPTVHTLTSTIRGSIRKGLDAVDVVNALFPCGSITGVPKVRAMEIIDDLERDRRGAYTGSMGWIAPEGHAEFNVAIRTISIGSTKMEVGLGSAVVLDSTAAGEWAECAAKGAFLTAGQSRFELFETMKFEPGRGVALLALHLARLRRSASVFDFPYDKDVIDAAIAAQSASAPCIFRLVLSDTGAVRIETRPLPAPMQGEMLVDIAPLPVRPDDFRLAHKTSLRSFYEAARADKSSAETVFVDEAGFITEGTIANVFVEREGVLLTPPVTRGLLPGVLRASLLKEGRAREADLRAADLEPGFFVGNAVRGIVPARLIG